MQSLADTLLIMLRPIVRLCLRSGVGIQEFLESAKIVFVSVAKEQLEAEKQKANISRISVATGLHRRDVDRILERRGEPVEPVNLLSRVLTVWETQDSYKTATGKPRVLTCEGDTNEFYALVKSVTSDVHPSSILAQVERVGLAERTSHGLKLIAGAQDVKKDLGRGYHILAQDLEDLSSAVEHNLLKQPELPNLHARTEFDNIFEDSLPYIQEWLLKEGSSLHQRTRALLSEHDADLQAHTRKKAGCRVVLTCFARVDSSGGKK
jgi:hypothetical protein